MNQQKMEKWFKKHDMTAEQFRNKYESFDDWWDDFNDETLIVEANIIKAYKEFYGYLNFKIDEEDNEIDNQQNMTTVVIVVWPGFIGLSSSGDAETGLDS